MTKGRIHSICISAARGTLKSEVKQAQLISGFGIEGDGHAGEWGRQVTCLAWESVQKINKEKNMNIGPGQMAENILIEGLDFSKIGVGEKIKIGSDAVLEVSQIGKEDHPSVVTRTFGVSLLPHEGLFCRVVSGGTIHQGDTAEII